MTCRIEGERVATGGITFDFHNTVASCDDWFQLEVRHLVSSFVTWHSTHHDATLSDLDAETVDAAYRQLRQEIQAHGREQTAEQCIATVLDRLNLSVPDEVIERGVYQLMRETFPTVEPMLGVVETVRTLADAGIPLGIVSSAVYHPFLEWTLEHFAIRDAFISVVTSASSGYYKSRPEIYQVAATSLGVDAASIVHIGDSLKFDVGGAQKVGMRTVWVKTGSHPGDGDLPTPDLTLHTLDNAAPAILALLPQA